MGIGDGRVHEFCEKASIPILAEIPNDRQIAEAYSEGKLLIDALPKYRGLFEEILEKIERLAKATTDREP
jgi:MinD superfamily P-loop ATPase containing an inserted ferredoxin domain